MNSTSSSCAPERGAEGASSRYSSRHPASAAEQSRASAHRLLFQCQRLKPQLFAESTKLHLPRLRGRYPSPIPRSASAGALRAGGLVGQSLRSTQSGRAQLVSLGKCQRRTLRGTANDRATDKDASAVLYASGLRIAGDMTRGHAMHDSRISLLSTGQTLSANRVPRDFGSADPAPPT